MTLSDRFSLKKFLWCRWQPGIKLYLYVKLLGHQLKMKIKLVVRPTVEDAVKSMPKRQVGPLVMKVFPSLSALRDLLEKRPKSNCKSPSYCSTPLARFAACSMRSAASLAPAMLRAEGPNSSSANAPVTNIRELSPHCKVESTMG